MKILSITAQKPDSTGSGIYLASMVKAFADMGHDQAVIAGIAPEDEPCFPQGVGFFPVVFEGEDLPFPVAGMSDTMPYPSTLYKNMTQTMVELFEKAFIFSLDEALHSFDPDIVICHHLYLLCAIVRERVSDRKVMAICHSTDIRQMNKHTLERGRILRAMRKVDRVFALHEGQKREIHDTYGILEKSVTVLGAGFDREVFHPGAIRTEQSTAKREEAVTPEVQAIFVGKVCEKKGIVSLIRSLGNRADNAVPINLRLAGGHNSPEEYRMIESLAQDSRHTIEFLGCVKPNILAEEYRRADIFILPSFFEGLPLVVLEALACGCGVVVTDLPGIRSWLQTQIPQAPIVFVDPPRLKNTDEAFAEDLPGFERRLAQAIDRCVLLPQVPLDIDHLSWKGLCARLLSYF